MVCEGFDDYPGELTVTKRYRFPNPEGNELHTGNRGDYDTAGELKPEISTPELPFEGQENIFRIVRIERK
jgi:hypothetical protein